MACRLPDTIGQAAHAILVGERAFAQAQMLTAVSHKLNNPCLPARARNNSSKHSTAQRARARGFSSSAHTVWLGQPPCTLAPTGATRAVLHPSRTVDEAEDVTQMTTLAHRMLLTTGQLLLLNCTGGFWEQHSTPAEWVTPHLQSSQHQGVLMGSASTGGQHTLPRTKAGRSTKTHAGAVPVSRHHGSSPQAHTARERANQTSTDGFRWPLLRNGACCDTRAAAWLSMQHRQKHACHNSAACVEDCTAVQGCRV